MDPVKQILGTKEKIAVNVAKFKSNYYAGKAKKLEKYARGKKRLVEANKAFTSKYKKKYDTKVKELEENLELED